MSKKKNIGKTMSVVNKWNSHTTASILPTEVRMEMII